MKNQNTGKTYIATNIRRQTIFINSNGDEIDPRTKQVIRKNEAESRSKTPSKK